MSQADMIVSDAPGATVRADINTQLQALASTSKGPSAPSTAYAGQLWLDDDTPSSTVWTLNQYDGTDWIPLGYLDTTNNLLIPKLPTGGIIQSSTGVYSTYSSHTTVIPVDNTIPQNTEGSEILTVSITPKFAGSTIRGRLSGYASGSAALTLVAAVFRDSTANAVAATCSVSGAAGYAESMSLEFEVPASAATSTTFKVRVGPAAAGTLYANGGNAARYFGGVEGWRLTLEEIAA